MYLFQKIIIVKVIRLEYKDKQYDIESVTKDRLEVKDSNGKEYQVPIKDE